MVRTLIILCLVLVTSAIADDGDGSFDDSSVDSLRSRRRKMWKLSQLQPRKVSSLSESKGVERTSISQRSSSKLVDQARASFLFGLTSLSNTLSEIQASRAADQADRGFSFGIMADARRDWLGLEVDLYKGIVPERTVHSEDSQSSYSRSGSQSGLLLNGKVQKTYAYWGVHWIPKAGLGYGTMSMSDTRAEGANEVVDSLKLKGPFITVGLEIHPLRILRLSLDYATSLSASGNFSQNEEVTEIQNQKFSRVRIGAYFRAYSRFHLGTQYSNRSMQFAVAPKEGEDPIEVKDSQTHFLWLVMYEL